MTLTGDTRAIFKTLKGSRLLMAELFPIAAEGRIKSNVFEMQQSRFRFNLREKCPNYNSKTMEHLAVQRSYGISCTEGSQEETR